MAELPIHEACGKPAGVCLCREAPFNLDDCSDDPNAPSRFLSAAFARRALELYINRVEGQTKTLEEYGADAAVADLLGDLMHFCTVNELSWDELLESAYNYYENEVLGEE